MFGLFKSKSVPAGPIEFEFAVEIARPPAEVYPLIDWADPRNAKRQLGNAVTEVEGEGARFELVLNGLPDHRFEIAVLAAEPGRLYEFAGRIVPRVGRLVASQERYTLEPEGPLGCRLTLHTTAEFEKGLRMREFQHELSTMAAAVQSALEKLKIQAEHGLGAARAVEGRLVL